MPVDSSSIVSDLIEQGCVTISGGTFEYEYSNANQALGTGTKVSVFDRDHQLVDTYTVVIFGDVSGEGICDGYDAFLVNCIVNGLLTEEQVGIACYAAADCNHDGTINNADAALLESVGLMQAQVDQRGRIAG